MNLQAKGVMLLFILMPFRSSGNLLIFTKHSKSFGPLALSGSTYFVENQIYFNQNLKQKKRRSKGRSGNRNGPEGAQLISLDIFVGGAKNFAFGNFFEAQKLYYETNSTLFPASVLTKDIYSLTAGVQGRYSPFLKSSPAIGLLGFGLGLSFLQRGYSSEFATQNLTLEYIDKTGINESVKASYLSTSLFIRYGNRLFFEIGPTLDWLISGKLKYQLTRITTGSKAYEGEFNTGETKPDEALKSDFLKSGGMGWALGFGGLFTPMFGARFQTTYNPVFFKEGTNLANLQFSIQATVTIN